MLAIFDEVALAAVLVFFPSYERIHSEIHVRISELPLASSLRELRRSDLNNLVRLTGVVTRRSGVFPQLKYVKFDCRKCGGVLGPFYQDGQKEIQVSFCANCESKGPFTVNSEQTVYRNYQKMTLQESPGSVPAGRLPRHREVILLWDLIDSAKPGEEVVRAFSNILYPILIKCRKSLVYIETISMHLSTQKMASRSSRPS